MPPAISSPEAVTPDGPLAIEYDRLPALNEAPGFWATTLTVSRPSFLHSPPLLKLLPGISTADDITKIVQQSDIDSAKQKIESQDSTAVKQQLQSQLNNLGLYAVTATFTSSSPSVTSNVKAGEEADSVTVTQTMTYTMLGSKQSDLKAVINDAVKDKIDESKESIIDYGLGKASFTTQNAGSGSVKMQVTAIAGPDLKIAELKKKVAGQKTGDAKKIIKDNPGVTDVTVEYSPFWVTSVPSDQGKVSITIDEPQVKKNAD